MGRERRRKGERGKLVFPPLATGENSMPRPEKESESPFFVSGVHRPDTGILFLPHTKLLSQDLHVVGSPPGGKNARCGQSSGSSSSTYACGGATSTTWEKGFPAQKDKQGENGGNNIKCNKMMELYLLIFGAQKPVQFSSVHNFIR